MRISNWFVLATIVAGVSALLLVASPEGGGRTPASSGPTDCEESALAVLNAAKLEAEADYWIRVAGCLNGPAGDFAGCEEEAAEERDLALELAQAQYEARLAICAALGGGAYDPRIDPSEFSTKVDNVYFPLRTGRTLVYQKRTEEGLETVEVRAQNDTFDIGGFLCRAVRDIVRLDGEVVEDTIDWYAQRSDGSVWYFGEIARNFEDGFLDNLDGSWRTYKDGALPGIVMLASPAPGDFYRQEFLLNEAEDVARVVSLGETVTVPYGTFTRCLQTEESNPFQPGHVEWKYYAPDLGLVLEVDPASGERLELVRIKR